MPPPLLVNFVGGAAGAWTVTRSEAVAGPPLPKVPQLDVIEGATPMSGFDWCLRGVASNERYVERGERTQLTSRQEGLGRPAATLAALIPIRKRDDWWSLPQDERRDIFEARSAHIAIGLDYLPAIARRLHHSRDLGGDFDFLTWFEYSPDDEHAFEHLVHRLRATPEWQYVDREIDIRLTWSGSGG